MQLPAGSFALSHTALGVVGVPLSPPVLFTYILMCESLFVQDYVFACIQFVNFDISFFRPDCLSTSSYTAWCALITYLLLIVDG